MNYALIQNGIITNVIVIYKGNAHDFPNAVPTGDVPVQIGDTYTDGQFFRDGEPLLPSLEQANAIIAELDDGVVDLNY